MVIQVVVNELNDAPHHRSLRNAPAQDVIPGIVLVHPHLNDSLSIDGDMLFLHLEAPRGPTQYFEAAEALVVDVQTVGEGDVPHVTKSNGGLLEEEAVAVGGGAEAAPVLLLEEVGPDQLRVGSAHFEHPSVECQLRLAPRVHLVLFDAMLGMAMMLQQSSLAAGF